MHGLDPVWMVLVVGAITFILGFAGCVGALRENICLLKFVRPLPLTVVTVLCCVVTVWGFEHVDGVLY